MNKLFSSILEPESINDVIGQSHLVGKGKVIDKMITNQKLFSLILFGPPGVGKSYLAKAICKSLQLPYWHFNPTAHTKKDLEKFLTTNNLYKKVIIIDEFHRMNRDKQDILLSYLEKDKVYIIATTTENPFFVINPAIRSRCQLLQLKPIDYESMHDALIKIVKKYQIPIQLNLIGFIIQHCRGDIRSCINLLDLISSLYPDGNFSESELHAILPDTNINGSSYGNEFYDLQSAFHKSLRGSDIDASIYYLARLIKIGDIQSIKRRIIAMAYEDVGLANPPLLQRVVTAMTAVDIVGFPEANQILATIVIELCLSPKSNSAINAINLALQDVDNGFANFDIPTHLKDNHYKSASQLGIKGYKYPHDYENAWVKQQYLPDEIKNVKYYFMNNNEYEQKLNQNFQARKQDRKIKQ